MKKIMKSMAIVMAFAMLLILSISASAANSMTISATKCIGKAGDEVTVDVNIEANPGMNYLKLKVGYNSDVMTITSSKDGRLFEAISATPGKKDANPYVMVYAGTSDESVTGKLFSVTFKIAENAATGDYNVNLTVEQCVNEANENVDVSTTAGKIKIEAQEPSTHAPTTEPTTPAPTTEPTTPKPTEPATKPPVTNPSSSFRLGDINDDGKITASDARAILRISAKLDKISDDKVKVADIDGNGKITASDARLALRISAKLDKIENYTKIEATTKAPTTKAPTTAAPTTKDPTTQEPTTLAPTTNDTSISPPGTVTAIPSTGGDKTYINEFLGKKFDILTTLYPEFIVDENNHSEYDEVLIDVDSHGMIYDIYVGINSEHFCLFGIDAETTVDEAIERFFEYGYVFAEGSSFGYNENDGSYVWYLDDDSNIVGLGIYFENAESDTNTDLSVYYLDYIDTVLEDITELEFNEEFEWYETEGVHILPDFDDIVKSIAIESECKYNLFGISVGTDYTEAIELLETQGFEDCDGYYCNEELDGYVVIDSSDESDVVTYVELYWILDDSDYFDLSNYLGEDVGILLEMFELENDESAYVYYNDYITIHVDENDFVREIDLLSDELFAYCIFDVYIGDTYSDAVETLAEYGFMEDDEYVFINEYDNTIVLLFTDESDNVSTISYYSEDDLSEDEIDLAEYVGYSIDYLFEVVTDLEEAEDDECYYSNDWCYVWTDEDGYVEEIGLIDYQYDDEIIYTIGGLYYGMDVYLIDDILEENGYIDLYNEELDVSLLYFLDEDDCIDVLTVYIGYAEE